MIKKIFSSVVCAFVFALLLPSFAVAGPIMPDFATVLAGWVTDRYQPAGFSNVGVQHGRNNVLGISISRDDGATATARVNAGQTGMFYNTQGMQYAFASLQGGGSVLSADLWIPEAWSDASNGARRTDMWGVLSNGTPSPGGITGYPIIGFTNVDGGARLRYWTDAGWTNLATPVNYNAWTSFAMELAGNTINFMVNGSNVGSYAFVGTAGFSAAIMQAYNFYDPANFPNVKANDYRADWSNTQVPEPTTLGLLGLGLVFTANRLRRRRA